MDNIVRIAFIGLAVLLAANTAVRAAQRSDEMAVFAGRNYSVAASKALLLAERGNAQAQAILGFIYEHGRGVPQDYAAAVRWYVSAAEQGYPTA
ncbi:MAG: SEL1-like repeat protein [Pseudolabrys sp.]